MERKHDRAKDKTTMTISLERTLLDRIDALAKKDRRPRSNWVVNELQKRVAVLESFGGAGESAGADAGGPSLPSTRTPAGTPFPEPRSDIRLNEEPNPKPLSSGPRARSTRAGIAKTVARKTGKEPS